MSLADEILKAERPKGDTGWIEYCILKMWEDCSNSAEYIADNAAEELAALRARVEALEVVLRFAVNNKANFTEHDPDGVKRAWIERAVSLVA